MRLMLSFTFAPRCALHTGVCGCGADSQLRPSSSTQHSMRSLMGLSCSSNHTLSSTRTSTLLALHA